MAFSPGNAARLLTISLDANHTARIWDWRKHGQVQQRAQDSSRDGGQQVSELQFNERFFSAQCHSRTVSCLVLCCWRSSVMFPVSALLLWYDS